MAHSTAEIGRDLGLQCESIADAVAARHYQLRPELESRYGQRGRQKCRDDISHHVTYLAQSLVASEPSLFRDYVGWAKVMLAGRGIPASDLADNLQTTIDVLKDRLPAEDASAACRYVQDAIANLPGMVSTVPNCMAPDQPLAQLADSYLAALLACDRRKAARLILDAVQDGAPIKDVYIRVFQQSQHEIGRLWQINQISVAQEHYCTAATQMIMSQLYPQIFAGPRNGRCFMGACVGGDLHEIGMRIVADFFEMDGWDTVYLGASVPGPDLIRTIEDRKPDVVGISATLTTHVAAVAQMISDIRAALACGNVKILVGGHPFQVVPELWKKVNADGTAQDAQGVVDLAEQLMQTGGDV
jgi:methanogenic corrinoid protein MtbC1